MPFLASIPSPSVNGLHIGSFELRLYGLSIMAGVLAAVWLSGFRWERRGGSADDTTAIALWAVPAGLIGARAYHVVTDFPTYEGHYWQMFAIWKGGLGIPGGVLVGVAAGAFVARQRRLPVAILLDVVAPALPLAQALGRFGNYFNQELFGRPTKLPWGLEIDIIHRPPGYEQYSTFHPTFLYEMLWNLALVGLILWLDARNTRAGGRLLRRANLFVIYLLGYGIGRFWVESLRIDFAEKILGLRVNLWVSAIAAVVALIALVVRQRNWDRDTDPNISPKTARAQVAAAAGIDLDDGTGTGLLASEGDRDEPTDDEPTDDEPTDADADTDAADAEHT